ncbi:hypothetical protein FRX31_015448 [Thalictrum thalictroides]|uniref:Uncharacterized protein n=1 Tax=Thalictrum thalictroides TaxID=46969 RepID=A0A7J6WEX9_THATH|nr:hypothetical protein FRX31_015448 [Thalictrum thalictroides]
METGNDTRKQQEIFEILKCITPQLVFHPIVYRSMKQLDKDLCITGRVEMVIVGFSKQEWVWFERQKLVQTKSHPVFLPRFQVGSNVK